MSVSCRVLLLVLLSLVACVNSADDKLMLVKNNEVINGRVKKADLTEVEIEIKDPKTMQLNQRKFKTEEVAEIEFDLPEREWREGMAAFTAGNYASAAQKFGAMTADSDDFAKIRNEVKPSLYYYLGESLYRAGKTAEAVEILNKMMAEYKTSWHVPMVMGTLVDAAIQANEFNKVPTLLGQLRTLGGEPKALADYYEGQMLLAQKKTKEADAKFTSAVSSNSATTRGLALMGQATCAIAENNLPKARELATKALANSPTHSVAGAAHLIIGDALMAEIDRDKPTGEALEKKLMDALLEYMRVVEQYNGDPRTEPQAIFRAGEVLFRLSKTTRSADKADRNRGQTMLTRLTADPRYRNSSWAQQAAELMKKGQ